MKIPFGNVKWYVDIGREAHNKGRRNCKAKDFASDKEETRGRTHWSW